MKLVFTQNLFPCVRCVAANKGTNQEEEGKTGGGEEEKRERGDDEGNVMIMKIMIKEKENRK